MTKSSHTDNDAGTVADTDNDTDTVADTDTDAGTVAATDAATVAVTAAATDTDTERISPCKNGDCPLFANVCVWWGAALRFANGPDVRGDFEYAAPFRLRQDTQRVAISASQHRSRVHARGERQAAEIGGHYQDLNLRVHLVDQIDATLFLLVEDDVQRLAGYRKDALVDQRGAACSADVRAVYVGDDDDIGTGLHSQVDAQGANDFAVDVKAVADAVRTE